MRYYSAVLFTLFVFGLPMVAHSHPDVVLQVADSLETVGSQLAAVIITHNPKSVSAIQSEYASATQPSLTASSSKVRILIVPGHEPTYGGAEFKNLKERDLTVELGQDLQGFLSGDSHYQVFVTRDTQSWSPDFAQYFKDSWSDIVAWEKASSQEYVHLLAIGSTAREVPKVYHNDAPQNVALRLYGITKWANDNNIDITIHIHFNDDTEHEYNVPGKYSGFAIYVPDDAYANSTTSNAVAQSVFKRLAKYNPVSDLKGESTGIIQEPDLIAIGAHNTANAATMLIEYSYIYEPQMLNTSVRSLFLKDLAYQTYLGIQDFFNASADQGLAYDTLMLPHTFNSSIDARHASSTEVVSLQTALLLDGVYPPVNRSLNDCPRSGSFGACTKAALDVFQKNNSISDEKGIVGPKTRDVLNSLYANQSI